MKEQNKSKFSKLCLYNGIYYHEMLKENNIFKFYRHPNEINSKDKEVRIKYENTILDKIFLPKKPKYTFLIDKRNMKKSDSDIFCDLHGNTFTCFKGVFCYTGEEIEQLPNNLIKIKSQIYDLIKHENTKICIYDNYFKFITKDYIYIELKTKLFEKNPFKTYGKKPEIIFSINKDTFKERIEGYTPDTLIRIVSNPNQEKLRILVIDNLLAGGLCKKVVGEIAFIKSPKRKKEKTWVDLRLNQILKYFQTKEGKSTNNLTFVDTGKYTIINKKIFIYRDHGFFAWNPAS